MTPHPSGDWQQLAQQASTESDPERLISLVKELNQVLEENETLSRQRQNLAAAFE